MKFAYLNLLLDEGTRLKRPVQKKEVIGTYIPTIVRRWKRLEHLENIKFNHPAKSDPVPLTKAQLATHTNAIKLGECLVLTFLDYHSHSVPDETGQYDGCKTDLAMATAIAAAVGLPLWEPPEEQKEEDEDDDDFSAPNDGNLTFLDNKGGPLKKSLNKQGKFQVRKLTSSGQMLGVLADIDHR